MNNVPVLNPDGSLLATTADYYTVQWEATAEETAAGLEFPVYVLNHYGYNISTLAGQGQLPPVVGENAQRTNRHGRRWRKKVTDQRPLTLSMWVRGSFEDDRFGMPFDQRQQFNANWQTLKGIFGVFDRQLLLTRRVDLPDGLLMQYAKAELRGDMDPTPQGEAAATFSVNLIMADPFWYGDPMSTSLFSPYWSAGGRTYPRSYDLSYGVNTGGTGLQDVVNPGMVSTPAVITLYGAWKSPITLQNNLLNQQFILTPDVPLTASDVTVIDFDERSVMWNGQDRYSWMVRSSKWWQLYKGDNQVFARDATSGGAFPAGTASIAWTPRYW